jgi:hypothetical protein
VKTKNDQCELENKEKRSNRFAQAAGGNDYFSSHFNYSITNALE